MTLPDTVTIDTALLIAVGLLLALIGAVLAWLGDHARVTRANELLAKSDGLGRAWLVPAPPTGRIAALKGLPAWVHLYTRHGQLDHDSGVKDEVPVVVNQVVKEITAEHPTVKPSPLTTVVRTNLWGDREEHAWRTKGGPLPRREPAVPRLGLRARAGIAIGRTLRALAAVGLLGLAYLTPRRVSGGRHRKTRGTR